MKIIIQRVTKSQVSIEGQVQGKINQGLLLLVGVGPRGRFGLCCEKACQHEDFFRRRRQDEPVCQRY